jgi:4-hydroxy-2-oxoglutarate aldolase
MLKSAERETSGNGELVPVTALAGDSRSQVEHRISSGTMSSSAAVRVVGGLKTRQKEVGFQICVGAAQKLHSSLQAGAIGAILAFACPAPTACYEIYAAWKEGDQELARTKQERIAAAGARVGAELGIPGLKYAMDFNGYYGGPPRLPLLPLTADQRAEVEGLMADVRN